MPPRTPFFAAVAATALLALSACEGVSLEPAPTSTGSTKDATASASELDTLKVVTRAGSMSGYSREKFPHWRSTGSNCDVRDSVLKRDGRNVKTSGCNVVAGTWTSFYDGKVLNAPDKVDIDHMVPLANAWRSGASKWTTDQREEFANDLDDPQLIAVSASSNRSKGDQDPSTWKPTESSSWCEYAQDWIAVKVKWKLTVTTKEKTALEDMLGSC
ncbi:HNH endonuclease [Actinoplanes sp. LDG1-06]|uniref:HNH endonuclease n=1 Tax=Paractinoplanes ovalisporus TaxID=2810368 RepID=A0ABS2ABD7_9ACTN|nr:HNH endonuclease family protein [Actinoplanes ovalisporus]MBM2617137.1 HNH endonuclease [Actinoplanes ovalisporus]